MAGNGLGRSDHSDRSPYRRKVKMSKMKTHSGAKKRLQVLKSGKVKRKQTRMRHLNSHMSSKTKRHLGQTVYVADANMLQIRRCLVF
jgi:large subunit ribosomal protein L35